MQRVVVVGSTGAGKSTFAKQLARRLGALHVELDALHWDPGWTAAPRDLFRERATAALAPDGRWVVDGNYKVLRDVVWGRADTLIWLDYAFPLVLWRLTWRILRRGISKTELYNGNRESLWTHLFTRESLFLWLAQSHWRHRREFRETFARREYDQLRVLRFRRPADAQSWIERVTC